jgi:hypothetical protein
MKHTCCSLLLILLPSAQCFAATPGNAAVKYLRADIALRQAYALEPNAVPALEKALQAPLSENDEKLVAAAAEALTEFRNAAAMATCDWDLSTSDGPNANTSHRGAIQELVAVSAIRARLRFRDGKSELGLQDWLAASAAARQLSNDGTITSVLISYKLERELSNVVESELGKLSRDQLDALENGIGALPPGTSIQSAISAEKLDRSVLADLIGPASSRNDAVRRLIAGVPILQGNEAKAQEIVDGCGGSVEGLHTCIRKQAEFYSEWNSRWAEPPARFEADYNAAFLAASTDNPILAHFTPSLARLRWAEAYSQTNRMLLRAAIAVERDGAGALSSYTDPSTGSPFVYAQRNGVVRLQSKVEENGTPLAITIQASRLR